MWYQIKLHCNKDETEICEDILLSAGAVSISLQDAKDEPIFEPALGTIPIWEFTDVLGLFEQTTDVTSVKKYLKKHLPKLIQDTMHIEMIPEKDWIKQSMEDWKPLSFGKKLWISPSWQNTHSTDSKRNNIILDPGLAFGTGTHPTTRLCLEWLDAHLAKKTTLIDYGCGSGILGIAALKLGAKQVFAVDHDSQALKSTENNAMKNGFSKKEIITMLPLELLKKLPLKVDLIIANILANPLIELASAFAKFLVPQGRIVLSGILTEQEAEIETAYRPWFSQFEVTRLEDWLCITAYRKEA